MAIRKAKATNKGKRKAKTKAKPRSLVKRQPAAGETVRYAKSVRVVTADGRRPKLIAAGFVFRKIGGRLVMEAMPFSGPPGGCHASFDEDGKVVGCFGTCKRNRFCNMRVTKGRNSSTVSCGCDPLVDLPSGPIDVITIDGL